MTCQAKWSEVSLFTGKITAKMASNFANGVHFWAALAQVHFFTEKSHSMTGSESWDWEVRKFSTWVCRALKKVFYLEIWTEHLNTFLASLKTVTQPQRTDKTIELTIHYCEPRDGHLNLLLNCCSSHNYVSTGTSTIWICFFFIQAKTNE